MLRQLSRFVNFALRNEGKAALAKKKEKTGGIRAEGEGKTISKKITLNFDCSSINEDMRFIVSSLPQ